MPFKFYNHVYNVLSLFRENGMTHRMNWEMNVHISSNKLILLYDSKEWNLALLSLSIISMHTLKQAIKWYRNYRNYKSGTVYI